MTCAAHADPDRRTPSDRTPSDRNPAELTPADLTPTEAARFVFAHQLEAAVRFANILATDGVEHGHIGPREAGRLWDRHLVNSALVTDLLPEAARVVDVGSGAGLPGIPMALRRADLRLDLVEPMLRRVRFLESAVDTLGLADRVRVIRGRADEPGVVVSVGSTDWVVARAVAPLDRLLRWTMPLLVPGGRLLALKGVGAAAEVREHRAALSRLGAGDITIHELGADMTIEPTRVVQVTRAARRPAPRAPRRAR